MKKNNSSPLYGPFADWRKPEDYPVTEKTSPDQWAWEFLRRNPKYQKQCQNFEGKTILLKDRYRGIRKKFGVKEALPPTHKKPGFCFFIQTYTPTIGGGHNDNTWQEVVTFDLRYPLKSQFKDAEKALNRIQKDDNRLIFNRRVPWDSFPEFLRLLDAESMGIPQKEMYCIYSRLDAPQQAVNHGLTEAKKWQDQDYRLLPILGPFSVLNNPSRFK